MPSSDPINVITQLATELDWPKYWPKNVSVQDQYGNTLLHHVIRKGYFDQAVILLNMGADPYIQNQRGFSPLHFWAKTEFEFKDKAAQKLLKWFQDHPLDWNRPDQDGRTPIFYAIEYSEFHLTPLVDYLVALGADLEYQSKGGDTPFLTIASHFRQESMAYATDNDLTQFLSTVKAGANINAQNSAGQTALHFMYEPSLIEKLLEEGADLDIKDNQGLTPMDVHQNDPDGLAVLFKWKSLREQKALEGVLEPRQGSDKTLRI